MPSSSPLSGRRTPPRGLGGTTVPAAHGPPRPSNVRETKRPRLRERATAEATSSREVQRGSAYPLPACGAALLCCSPPRLETEAVGRIGPKDVVRSSSLASRADLRTLEPLQERGGERETTMAGAHLRTLEPLQERGGEREAAVAARRRTGGSLRRLQQQQLLRAPPRAGHSHPTPSQLKHSTVSTVTASPRRIGGGLKARAFHLPCESTRSTLSIIGSCGLFEGKGVSTSRVSPPGPLSIA
jgi:hypothetical protein